MKKILQNILLSFLSLIVFILLAEGVTRLLWTPNKDETDVRKGLILEGADRSVIYEGIEYKINSYGIRNRELSLEKDSNVTRIMALGDSFIWGDGLRNEDLVTVKLESTLKAKTGKDIEVVNTGIGGFNAQDEYEQLVRLYPIYKPEIVIQFFFTNDILATDEYNRVIDWKAIYHMWLKKHSNFYSWLYYIFKTNYVNDKQIPRLLLPPDLFNLNNKKPGWVNFKKYTGEIKKFCDSKEMRYYFVLIPTLTNLDENYPYIEIKEKVTEFVNTLQVPFLSYFGLFSRYKPVDLWVSESNTHWNGVATALAAEELAEFLIKNENW